MRIIPSVILGASAGAASLAQTPSPQNLNLINSGRIQPDYPVPYEPATVDGIKAALDRVLAYLEVAAPARVIDPTTEAEVTDLDRLPPGARLQRGQFQIMSYEWGVTYSGMLLTAEATGDARYRTFVDSRLHAITRLASHARDNPPPENAQDGQRRFMPFRALISPRSLDDSGSMCVALIKAHRAGIHPEELRPWIDNYIGFISKRQLRLEDGTFARNRPLHNALWLDDLYMSVPALAQMSVLAGEPRYIEDAVRQILQFTERMFVKQSSLYMHGWIQEMDPHPAFHWARANGWATVAMAELLSVMPEDHPQRPAILEIYRTHVAGVVARQSGSGLWHQLLDRSDTYLETSASAMFVYSIARGINRGWLHPLAYGPAVSVGWNAVAQKINEQGQVEGTCVGTGMGFDPMFYYSRPTSVFASHGYGPVLLAGAEMIALRKGKGSQAEINDGSLQFAPSPSRF